MPANRMLHRGIMSHWSCLQHLMVTPADYFSGLLEPVSTRIVGARRPPIRPPHTHTTQPVGYPAPPARQLGTGLSTDRTIHCFLQTS